MKYFKNIVETIGGTPLVKLNNVVETKALVLAKVESFNPGHSTKDRMALKMIEDAERKGIISKGATIIEGTSGNTGMGLALASIVKGYKLIVFFPGYYGNTNYHLFGEFHDENIYRATLINPQEQ